MLLQTFPIKQLAQKSKETQHFSSSTVVLFLQIHLVTVFNHYLAINTLPFTY